MQGCMNKYGEEMVNKISEDLRSKGLKALENICWLAEYRAAQMEGEIMPDDDGMDYIREVDPDKKTMLFPLEDLPQEYHDEEKYPSKETKTPTGRGVLGDE